jgi:hypothetical protein
VCLGWPKLLRLSIAAVIDNLESSSITAAGAVYVSRAATTKDAGDCADSISICKAKALR